MGIVELAPLEFDKKDVLEWHNPAWSAVDARQVELVFFEAV